LYWVFTCAAHEPVLSNGYSPVPNTVGRLWKRLKLTPSFRHNWRSAPWLEWHSWYIDSLDGLGIECQWGQDFPHLSRLALGLVQSPVQWYWFSFFNPSTRWD